MVSAAIIGTALGGSAAGPARSLYLDGNDVLKEAGSPGNRYGVPIDSITVTIAGAGGVDAMAFVLDDPGAVISPRRGTRVLYVDQTGNRPEFRGWLQSWTSVPLGLGRSWSFRCQGIQKILDWMVVPSLTIPALTNTGTAVQSVLANAIGVGEPFLAIMDPLAGNGYRGSELYGIAAFGNVVRQSRIVSDLVITSQSVRQALENVFRASALSPDSYGFGGADLAIPGVATIDAYGKIRAYAPSVFGGTDWTTLTVLDTAAGTFVASELEHATDIGDVPAGAYVTGGNAAGTGYVSAGDGIPGPILLVTDSSILTDDMKRSQAIGFLADRTPNPQRGEFDLVDIVPTGNVQPGGKLTLTDAQVGASGDYLIAQITKTYTATRQTWHVVYGGLRPSLPRAIRRLTRFVMS